MCAQSRPVGCDGPASTAAPDLSRLGPQAGPSAQAPPTVVGVRSPGWRWAVVAGLTAVLSSVPALVQALPVDDVDVDAVTLLERVRQSDTVAWSGYGEARGDLVLPDVSELEDIPELISGTTRLRAWWRGRDQYRVDALSLVGETDVAVNGLITWTWDSADRLATVTTSVVAVRLPRGADLLAPALAARLARSDAVVAEELPSRRVAGVDAAGLRLLPAEPRTTNVEHVDLWVEPETGLGLRVELHARDVDDAALTSVLLDLDTSTPSEEQIRFRPPPDARVESVEAPDLASAAARYAPFRLPAEIAGLRRQDRVDGFGEGVGTYGEGFTALTVVPLEGRTAAGLLDTLRDDDDPPGEAEFSTALLQGRVARYGERAYLVVGTVPQAVLRSALAQLRVSPPPRTRP